MVLGRQYCCPLFMLVAYRSRLISYVYLEYCSIIMNKSGHTHCALAESRHFCESVVLLCQSSTSIRSSSCRAACASQMF